MEKDSSRLLHLLKELTDAPGVPGNEREVRKVMEKWITPYADEIQYDRLGSLLAKKNGLEGEPSIMVASHLDEIGFMVTNITDQGFLKIEHLGFWWTQNMMGQRVNVHTENGEIPGILGFRFPVPNLLKKILEMKDMFIDIGVDSKEEAESLGVRPGDMVVPDSVFTCYHSGKMVSAKALDNRAGCAIVTEVMKNVAKHNFKGTVFGVGTVQEEVGPRGAKTAAHVAEPDIMIAVDVCIANDVPGDKTDVKLGKGPVIFISDHFLIPHTSLKKFVIETAEEHNIPYQLDTVKYGGTDAGEVQYFGKGVPSIAITVPTRYAHSHNTMMNMEDFQHAIDLVTACVLKINRDFLDRLHQ